jgi:CheY-like chemotaxis protein/tetratricopeptide (TPR) repeat protein
MNLQSQLTALQEQTRGLITAERAKLCCRLAKQFEKAGEYESAREALIEFWPTREEPPKLDELDEQTKAEVLLRVGALAGWLGGANQTEGSQETAKDLITQSIEIFEDFGQSARVAEARGDLALCYWREGSYDEARIHLANALGLLENGDSELKAVLLIRAGIVEVWALRLNEALRFYDEALPLVERSEDHALKGSFHIEFGLVFRRLAAPENREDYLDKALIEYAAASFHFEQAENERALARVENNLGYLFFTIGRYKDAHQHLDRARHLFLELKDAGTVAQVDDTRARTLLAEGRIVEAERFARQAVKTLEKGGEQALLAEALTTHGTALARLGNYSRSKALLERAIEVAGTAGDLEGSGRAKLSIIEELGEQTSARELASIYESAVDLLESSQDPSAKKRLVSCARAVIDALTAAEDDLDSEAKEHSWEGFSFRQEVVKIERALIERALRDTGGSVTKASRLLGFKHHQSLIALINNRHKNLLNTRSAIRKRRRHIFSKPRRIPRKVVKSSAERATTQISILHVEDNKLIAKLVDDMCAPEDWRVELCMDGDGALRKLTGNDHYDLLVVDNDLPGLSGLELVQRARKMTHRRRTPIVMLSGSDCETEAWGAGVDAFLKKPEQTTELPSTIARLLENGHEHA